MDPPSPCMCYTEFRNFVEILLRINFRMVREMKYYEYLFSIFNRKTFCQANDEIKQGPPGKRDGICAFRLPLFYIVLLKNFPSNYCLPLQNRKYKVTPTMTSQNKVIRENIFQEPNTYQSTKDTRMDQAGQQFDGLLLTYSSSNIVVASLGPKLYNTGHGWVSGRISLHQMYLHT